MKSVIFKAMAGLVGGFIAWVVMEPSAPKSFSDKAFGAWSIEFILLLSVLIAGTVCFIAGLQKGSWKRAFIEAGIGIVLGAIGGMFGSSIGSSLASLVFPGFIQGAAPLPEAIAWRILGLTPIGLCLGAGIGAAGLSPTRLIQGAIGGLLGGATAAAAFDVVAMAAAPLILASEGARQGEVGGPSRALYACLLGLAIGLFVGIAERVMSQAFVRLHLGRNEGREFVVDRPRFVLGRSEMAGVPLYGDAAVAPNHAFIEKQGDAYILVDGGAPAGTMLDGQRIQHAPLHHGAWIGIGSFQLQFLLKKAQPAPAYAGPGPDQSQTQLGYPAANVQPMPFQPMPGQFVPGQPMPGQGYPTQGYPTQAVPQMPDPTQAPQAGQPQAGQPQPVPIGSQTVAQPAQGYSAGVLVLTVLDGPEAGKVYPLDRPVEIGREAADIRLASDGQASRRHAAAAPGPNGAILSDLGSTNGTFVNGQRVSSSPLNQGDMIKIGSTNFRVDRRQ